MKVVFNLILSLLIAKASYSQMYDLNVFLNPSEAYDFCQDLKFNDSGDMLVLHQYHNFIENSSGPSEFVNRLLFPDQSYSVLSLYNNNGSLINKLAFPCNDSLYYYAFNIEFLENGTIAVLGHVFDVAVGKYDVFYANVAGNLSMFNELIIFEKPLTNEHFLGFHKKANSKYLIYYNQPSFTPVKDCLLEIDINGNTIRELLDFGSGLYTGTYLTNSFYLNEKFYHYAGYDDFVSIDNNNVITFYPNGLNDFNNDFYPLTKSGTVLNDTYYCNSSKGIYNKVIRYNLDNTFETIFEDTLSFALRNGYSKVFSLANKNNLYSAFSFTDSLGGIVLYNIDTIGNLNWKTIIRLDDYGLANGDEIVVQNVIATPEKGCLIAFGVKDQFDRVDCFILKVDSLGEQKDIFTGLSNSHKPLNLSIYPNPSFGEIVIDIQDYLLTGKEYIEFYNALGNRVGQHNLSNRKSYYKLSQNIKGIIFYRVIDEDKKVIQNGHILVNQ